MATLVNSSFFRTLLKNIDNNGILPYLYKNSLRGTKHWNPKWKWHRSQKVVKFELPDFHKEEDDPEKMTQDEMRSKLKERGILPPRFWNDRPFFVSSTGGVFEPYVPPEGDGKLSVISKAGAKQKYELLEKKSKSMMAIRKIRTFDEDFETFDFEKEAQQIYIKAHETLITQDAEQLSEYVTEYGIPEMLNNVKLKTLRWQFIKNIETPKVMHARCTDVITKTNIFAQITVRFHTQQVLAIFDRFGRLMHGSEILAKDVLEYIVFEKHLSNVYGKWRVHSKIIPDWMPLPEPPPKTFRAEQLPPLAQEPDTATAQVIPTPETTPTPAIAS